MNTQFRDYNKPAYFRDMLRLRKEIERVAPSHIVSQYSQLVSVLSTQTEFGIGEFDIIETHNCRMAAIDRELKEIW